jgi:hypothetical protein
MNKGKTYAVATMLAAAMALGTHATTLLAAGSSSRSNEHEPPADVAHLQANQSVAHRPVMRAENKDYKDAVKACKKLPPSEWTTCISEAGNSAKLASQARNDTGARK